MERRPVQVIAQEASQDGSGIGEWLPLTEACARLGIGRETLKKQAMRGAVQARKDDGKWLIFVPGHSREEEGKHQSPSQEGVPGNSQDDPGKPGQTPSAEAEIAFLRGLVHDLTRQLEREQAIVAALTQRVPQLIAAITTPAENGSTSRPWWRRLVFW